MILPQDANSPARRHPEPELSTCVHPNGLVVLWLSLMGRLNVSFVVGETTGGIDGGDAKGLGLGLCWEREPERLRSRPPQAWPGKCSREAPEAGKAEAGIVEAEKAEAGKAQSWDVSGAEAAAGPGPGPGPGKYLFPRSSCPSLHTGEERGLVRAFSPVGDISVSWHLPFPAAQLRMRCQSLSGERPVPWGTQEGQFCDWSGAVPGPQAAQPAGSLRCPESGVWGWLSC